MSICDITACAIIFGVVILVGWILDQMLTRGDLPPLDEYDDEEEEN